ncbi:MAG: hypothetical protein H0T50_14610 [Gemmatimonadales bacterium]|nr:hypothetical protein [Gemmatimonadales bacterium]
MPALIQFTYASSAAEPFDSAALAELLEARRKRNELAFEAFRTHLR